MAAGVEASSDHRRDMIRRVDSPGDRPAKRDSARALIFCEIRLAAMVALKVLTSKFPCVSKGCAASLGAAQCIPTANINT